MPETEKRISYKHAPIVPENMLLIEKPDVYRQKIDDLIGLPITTLGIPEEGIGTPNIFTAEGNYWQRQAEMVPLFFRATKADIGGVGGHVEVDPEVQAVFAEYILRYNRLAGRGNRPVFRSVFFTHTGDDVCAVGVLDARAMEHPEVADELLWDAFKKGAEKAKELGNYAPGQDLKVDTFSGNIKGMGPGSAILPLPFRPNSKDTSQTVLIATADKTEPGSYNFLTRGAYLDPNFNTGLLIAKSDMKKGYSFKIIDVDTKQQAIEAGASPTNEMELNEAMDKTGGTERAIWLKGPEDLYDLGALTMNSSRFVIAEIWTKHDDGSPKEIGVVVSAERLHNIKDASGRFVYGGKDDPVMLSLAQGNWPAPGEIVSPLARIPIVAGDCRGSHFLPWYPAPIDSQTSYWSGPIVSVITASVNLETGRIGSISDQLAAGTPWDRIRNEAAENMVDFRNSQGYTHPGTLGTGEMEYQDGFIERMNRLNGEFKISDLKAKDTA